MRASGVAASNARAAKLGLSRSEYIRRRLSQDSRTGLVEVEVADLHHFATNFTDLGDDAVISKVWE